MNEDITPELQEEIDKLVTNGYEEGAIKAYLSLGISDNLDDFEEAYVGKYDSDEEFAQDMHEQTSDSKNVTESQWPYSCIDWEWASRELMYDYSEEDGYYFRNL